MIVQYLVFLLIDRIEKSFVFIFIQVRKGLIPDSYENVLVKVDDSFKPDRILKNLVKYIRNNFLGCGNFRNKSKGKLHEFWIVGIEKLRKRGFILFRYFGQ